MTSPRYHIGTGYHESKNGSSPAMFHLWLANTLKYCDPWPQRITVMTDSGSKLPAVNNPPVKILKMELTGNLGHFMDLINNHKPYGFNGWSGTVLTLAMLAYCDEVDFIYKEQDAFAFGPWIERLYSELGPTAGMVFGNCSFMPCEQSIFLVRHGFIPYFVREFLAGPNQRTEDQLGEHRFQRMERDDPKAYKRFSFGVGRDRPIRWEDDVFYFQQPKQFEIDEARERGLL